MSFASRLKQLREEKGIQQSELAKILNISRQSVSNYENGTRFPSDEKLFIKMAEYFDVSVDYLFSLTNIRNYKDYYKTNRVIKEDDESYYNRKKEALQELFLIANNLSYMDLKKANEILKIINKK